MFLTQSEADRIRDALARQLVGCLDLYELLAAVDRVTQCERAPGHEADPPIAVPRTNTRPFGEDEDTVVVPLETMSEIVARGRRATVDL